MRTFTNLNASTFQKHIFLHYHFGLPILNPSFEVSSHTPGLRKKNFAKSSCSKATIFAFSPAKSSCDTSFSYAWGQEKDIHSLKLAVRTRKLAVGSNEFLFGDPGLFSGANLLLISRRVRLCSYWIGSERFGSKTFSNSVDFLHRSSQVVLEINNDQLLGKHLCDPKTGNAETIEVNYDITLK